MITGLLAAFGFAGGVLLDKFELSKRRLNIELYLPALFFLLAFLTGILLVLVPDQAAVHLSDISFETAAAFFAMIALALGWNIYYYRGLAKEKVQEFDLILLAEPLVVIALASLFFPVERQATTLLASLFAALALVYAHMNHRRITIDKYAKGLIIAVFLMALEVLVIRILLQTFSPVFLYFIRTITLFLIFSALYKPRFEKLTLADWLVISIIAFFGVMQMLARYFGYADGGVVITTLFLLLGPVLVEGASVLILHERLKFKTGLAFSVIFVCVAYISLHGAS